jgi:hypothetical protein
MLLPFTVTGNLGNIEGDAADGVLIGTLTAADPTVGTLETRRTAALCFTDDGGVYVDETATLADATADDVEVLPATPADDDAVYFGHATTMIDGLVLNQTTQGVGTWTITWNYWNGTAWTALSDVVDGTTGFTAATGWVTVKWTVPSDAALTTVDSSNAYWVQAVVSGYSAVTTAPQIGQGYCTRDSVSTWTDDLTDLTDAGTGDVALLPAIPAGVDDAFYFGYTAPFCKIKLVYSTALVGTNTILLEYWNGSAWGTVTTYDDDTAGYVTTAGTQYIHFVPPSDWAANTAANGPNSETGYIVRMRMSALTSYTTAPVGTSATIYPLLTGASGMAAPPLAGNTINVAFNAGTKSATNTDSVFIVVNTTTGEWASATWTKATVTDSVTATLRTTRGDEIALVQITEDGTTEFADANIHITTG